MTITTIFERAPGCSAAVLAIAIAAAPAPAAACGQSAYLGQVCLMATPFCPKNTTEASGQTMAINGNEALYSLIGCTFGGDCRVSMGLPDLRGRVPVGYGKGPGLTGTAVGEKWGMEVLTVAPTHTHDATFTPSGGGGTAATATGTVSLPVTGMANNLAVSASGSLKIANTAGGGQTTPANGAILTKASGAHGAIYATSGSADTTIGPAQTFTGTASGSIAGTAGGDLILPVTGGSGGEVTIASAGTHYPSIINPQLGLRYCIVTTGLYPPRR